MTDFAITDRLLPSWDFAGVHDQHAPETYLSSDTARAVQEASQQLQSILLARSDHPMSGSASDSTSFGPMLEAMCSNSNPERQDTTDTAEQSAYATAEQQNNATSSTEQSANVIAPQAQEEDERGIIAPAQEEDVTMHDRTPGQVHHMEHDSVEDMMPQFNFDEPLESCAGLDPERFFDPDFMDVDVHEQPTHDYELRPGARTDLPVFDTEDWDETGDFDPQVEAQRLRALNRRRRQAASRVVESEDEVEELADAGPGINQPLNVPRLSVLLKFQTQDGREAFTDKLNGFEIEQATEASTGRRLRTRNRAVPREDSDEEAHNGHPEARGCQQCRRLRLSCSLLTQEFEWPCQNCKDGDCDCVLVIPPARKLECSSCTLDSTRNKSLICSYAFDDDHSAPCWHCQKHGYNCCAEPDPAFTMQRTRIDDEDGSAYRHERPANKQRTLPRSCVRCQQTSQECSRYHDAAETDCKSCVEAGTTCVPLGEMCHRDHQREPSPLFVPQDSTSDAEEEDSTSDTEVESSTTTVPIPIVARPVSPPSYSQSQSVPDILAKSGIQILKEAQARRRPMLLHIKTKFCHPIVFMHIPNEEDPCSFCSSVPFQYFGYGEKRVLVAEKLDGRGWEEKKYGHAAEGRPQTKVCFNCTFERAAILNCTEHVMERIEVYDQVAPESAAQELERGVKKHIFCSVCVAVARFECKTCTTTDDESAPVSCGLVLCELCHVVLLAFGGDLTKMLGQIKDTKSKQRPRGLRADHELLKSDGLLANFSADWLAERILRQGT